jgi:hypothetical protein
VRIQEEEKEYLKHEVSQASLENRAVLGAGEALNGHAPIHHHHRDTSARVFHRVSQSRYRGSEIQRGVSVHSGRSFMGRKAEAMTAGAQAPAPTVRFVDGGI